MAATADALVDLARPWFAALRRLGSPTEAICDHSEATLCDTPPFTLWIDDEYLVGSSMSTAPRVARIRILEGVVLLAALARANAVAWTKAVREIWPFPDEESWINDCLFASESTTPTFALRVQYTHLYSTTGMNKLSRLCTPTDRDVVSSKFKAAYTLLEGMLGPHATQSNCWQVPLKIGFDFGDADEDQIVAVLERTLQCALQCRVNAAPGVAEKKVIVQIEDVEIMNIDRIAFNDTALRTWKEFTDFGVRINRFPDLAIGADKDQWRFVVETARSLLKVPGSVSANGIVPPDTETIVLSTQHSPHYFPGLVAAAQVSSSIRTADIEIVVAPDTNIFDPDDDELEDILEQQRLDSVGTYWGWIAYGLLSRHAEHQLTTLRMDVSDLRRDHVETMKAIVMAPDPLAQFYDEQHKCEPLRHLKASTLHLMDPDTESHTYVYNPDGTKTLLQVTKHQSIFLTPEPIRMRVIYPPKDADDSYWTVMIPGHGDGWVHKDEMTDLTEEPIPTDHWRAVCPTFEQIDITGMNDESIEASVELFKTVGREARSLKLSSFDGEQLLDDWVRGMLAVSPHVEEMIIGFGACVTMKVFVDLAEAGKSRLRKLVVRESPCDDVDVLFSSLCDPTHPLSRHLETLDVIFVVKTESEADRMVTAVQQVLHTNRRLHHLSLGFRLIPTLDLLESKIQDAFEKTNAFDDKVAIRAAPMELRSKLAFLSTVTHHGNDQTAIAHRIPALGQLDSSVLTQVFQFAAQSRPRRFVVNYMPLFPM